jgi:hypothetical protein
MFAVRMLYNGSTVVSNVHMHTLTIICGRTRTHRHAAHIHARARHTAFRERGSYIDK